MTEALTSVTGRTITRPITSVAGSRIDDVYGVDGEDGDEDEDESTTYNDEPSFLFPVVCNSCGNLCGNMPELRTVQLAGTLITVSPCG